MWPVPRRALMVRKNALRLEYLDGLRALAALYVVLFHAALFERLDPASLPPLAHNAARALSFGHDAVAVFIVLSGYCLMLPVARADGYIKRGLGSYFARRAFRILPPYYAALLGSLALLVVVPTLQASTHTIWDDSSPAFGFGPVGSHLLLIHNLFPRFANRINGPLWSVATEWQIYFFFPLFLLPIWRRFGALATVLVGFVVGCLPLAFAPATAYSANTWYLGLFALGMGAAGINFASRPSEHGLRTRAPLGLITLALLGACVVGTTVLIKFWFRVMPLSDALVGLATAAALTYLTRQALDTSAASRSPALRVLETPALVGLGRFSYSLYLTHLPVVALCYLALQRFALPPAQRMAALIAVSVPLSVAVAFAFFWVFERRFVGDPRAFFGRKTASAE